MALLAFLLLIPVFWAFGTRLAAWMGLPSESRAERFGLSLALAYGALTLVVFAIALAGALSLASASAVTLAMAAVGLKSFPDLRGTLRSLGEGKPWRVLWPLRANAEAWAAVLTLAAYAFGLVVALAPPTGMDAGVYHFTIPKVILQERGLVPREDLWVHKFGGFYMVYAFGMALGGEILAKLLAFGAAIAGGFLAFAAAERIVRGAGRWAAFTFASTPLVCSYLGTEWLETPTLMYALAGLLAFVRTLETGEARWAVTTCLLAGFTVSTKSSSFAPSILAPAALGLILARSRGRAWPSAALGAGLFVLTAGFWAAWNVATTGAPLYRYPGSSFDPVTAISLDGGAIGVGMLRTLATVATAGVYWDDSAGPFLFAGVAGAALLMGRGPVRGPLAMLALGIIVHLGVLAALSPVHLVDPRFASRYMGPLVIGFGVPVAACFAAWARSRGGSFGLAVTAAMLLPAFPLLALKAGKAAVAAPAAVGLESRSAYLTKKIETFAACEAVGRLDRPDVKVLFMGFRAYYLDRPFVHALDGTSAPFFGDVRGPEDFVRKLRAQRITHVLFEPQRSEQAAWLADPEAVLTAPPFREVARWPQRSGKSVLLVEVNP